MRKLFSPFPLKKLVLKNRVVMPPVHIAGYNVEEGILTDKHWLHYTGIAKGGAGLIIMEATAVAPYGRLSYHQLALWDDSSQDAFQRLAAECHKYGAKVFIQLFHCGFLSSISDPEADRFSPSVYKTRYRGIEITGRPMRLEDIKDVCRAFAEASLRAQKYGFDGVELHFAHSYLISQFLSPLVNKRDDEYGGSRENRVRFPAELIKSVRELVEDDFIVGVRMGSNENTLRDSLYYARIFEQAGVDFVHVSAGFNNDLPPDLAYPADSKLSWIAYSAGMFKKELKIPVIAVNKITTPELAGYVIDNGFADLVSLARAQLVDPDWCHKAQNHQKINYCLGCKSGCKWFKDPSKCPAKFLNVRKQTG
ncbi:MAG: NADH:flavin oxidoreductase [Syntrophomonadaceae bacterium]|jgi:2,4-dienoyl-CoA reductase-like NADH-dependent reductase (Old Yellow Enzyme family)|nr:NADH:flavin oxidoreductase [Syntrophomonadaceae bacterium]